MREALRDLFGKLANRPPVVFSAIGGLISLLGGEIDALEPFKELIILTLPIAFGYLASRFTVGPATGKALAEAVDAVQAQVLKNPDAPIESIAPPLKAVRAARRVLK